MLRRLILHEWESTWGEFNTPWERKRHSFQEQNLNAQEKAATRGGQRRGVPCSSQWEYKTPDNSDPLLFWSNMQWQGGYPVAIICSESIRFWVHSLDALIDALLKGTSTTTEWYGNSGCKLQKKHIMRIDLPWWTLDLRWQMRLFRVHMDGMWASGDYAQPACRSFQRSKKNSGSHWNHPAEQFPISTKRTSRHPLWFRFNVYMRKRYGKNWEVMASVWGQWRVNSGMSALCSVAPATRTWC